MYSVYPDNSVHSVDFVFSVSMDIFQVIQLMQFTQFIKLLKTAMKSYSIQFTWCIQSMLFDLLSLVSLLGWKVRGERGNE